MRKIFAAIFLFSLVFSRLGAEVTPPPLSGKIAIKAGRLLDVQTGAVATKVVILVEKDRIVSIGKTVPKNATVIDLSDQFVMPGMVDCHAHVLGNLKDFTPGAALRVSSAKATLWGLHNLQIWLDQGFTALRDAGEPDQGYGQIALRDSVREGLIIGPRMVSAGIIHLGEWRPRRRGFSRA